MEVVADRGTEDLAAPLTARSFAGPIVVPAARPAARSQVRLTARDEAAARSLSVTVEETADALERYVEAWGDLVIHAAEPNPFFEPEALLAAWRQLRPPELQVILVWAPCPIPGQPALLAGVFPLVRSSHYKGLPVCVLSTWTHLYAYLATPLVRAGMIGEVLDALFGWLRNATDAALIEWRTLGTDGPFRHALIDASNRLGIDVYHERSHTRAVFRPAATAEAYLTQSLPGKKRKELRRQERRLAELGAVKYDDLAPDGDLEPWLDELVALEQRGWKGQGGTALCDDPAALAAFRMLARDAFSRGRWMMLALRLDGRAIAMKCNLRAGAGAVAFKIAYDEAYARFSPGVLLEIEQIKRLHDPGAPAWMDSGAAPDHPMIGHLWRDRLAIENILMPTGRGAGGLMVAALPLARWVGRTLRVAARRLQSRPEASP